VRKEIKIGHEIEIIEIGIGIEIMIGKDNVIENETETEIEIVTVTEVVKKLVKETRIGTEKNSVNERGLKIKKHPPKKSPLRKIV
jgi:hypothetical protein